MQQKDNLMPMLVRNEIRVKGVNGKGIKTKGQDRGKI
jgi:hypothetical protein